MRARTGARSGERGAGLVLAVLISVIALSLSMALISVNTVAVRGATHKLAQARLLATAKSGLHHAIHEINKARDLEGKGVGVIGIGVVRTLNGAQYRVVTVPLPAAPQGNAYRLLCVAASPSFTSASPSYEAVEGLATGSFPFVPNSAAISVAGPAERAVWEFKRGSIVTVDGGTDAAAMLFGDKATEATVMAASAKGARADSIVQLENGVIFHDGPRGGNLTLVGNPAFMTPVTVLFGGDAGRGGGGGGRGEGEGEREGDRGGSPPSAGTFKAPIVAGVEPFLDEATLTALQTDFVARAAAQEAAKGTIVLSGEKLEGHNVYGSPAHPVTVVLAANDGGDRDGEEEEGHRGVSLTGSLTVYGTVIVHGTLHVRGREECDDREHVSSPTLEVAGNVLIVGRGERGKASLSNEGGSVTVNGALAILGNGARGNVSYSSGRGGGEEQHGEHGGDHGDGSGGRSGKTTVDGAFMVLAGNDCRRADRASVTVRDGSLTVNGAMSLMGARIKTLISGQNAEDDEGDCEDGGNPRNNPVFTVNGTLAVALFNATDENQFEMRFRDRASVSVKYDKTLFDSGLKAMDKTLLDLQLTTVSYKFVGWLRVPPAGVLDELSTYAERGGVQTVVRR